MSLVYGPIPSRRLGQSLGINNVPGKRCAYSCVYCQAGRPEVLSTTREAFQEPEDVVEAVREVLALVRARGGTVDHLAFVPDGEPTLDLNLGRTLRALRPFGIPTVVLTSGVLAGREDVAADLGEADQVSLKVDAGTSRLWHIVNRPPPGLAFASVRDGLLRFARGYRGRLATESMLLDGLNAKDEEIVAIAELVAQIAPATAYVSIPTRPPALALAHVPRPEAVFRLRDLLRARGVSVVTLTGDAGEAFAVTTDAEQALLDIAAVHPLQRHEAETLVRRCGGGAALVERLLAEGTLQRVMHLGREFVVRRAR